MEEKILRRKAKTKRSKKVYFKPEDSHIISDSAVIFIAFTMFLFGGLSYSGNLSDEYAIAASISSFLFVIAEWLLIEKVASGRRMLAHGLCFGAGIITLIFFPVLLNAWPPLVSGIAPTADMLTFFSIGFVLLLVGVKSLDAKIKAREKDREEKEQLEKQIQQLEKQILNASLKEQRNFE